MFFKWLKRKKQAKGFGIHSPFAFNFVTNVIYEKHGYNAFGDIEQLLQDNNLETTDQKLISYRTGLSGIFSQEDTWTRTGKGVNTLYISLATKGCNLSLF